MASTITGNLGGASASGVQITCYSPQTGLIMNAADASGNFSFAGLPAATYTLKAQDGSGKVNYLVTHQVIADGVTTYSNINFQPLAVNAGGTPLSGQSIIPNPNGTPTF
jgi:hypothetical protein